VTFTEIVRPHFPRNTDVLFLAIRLLKKQRSDMAVGCRGLMLDPGPAIRWNTRGHTAGGQDEGFADSLLWTEAAEQPILFAIRTGGMKEDAYRSSSTSERLFRGGNRDNQRLRRACRIVQSGNTRTIV
jgi:hypothetical protein